MPSELEGLIFPYFLAENRILGCLGGILEASWAVLAKILGRLGPKIFKIFSRILARFWVDLIHSFYHFSKFCLEARTVAGTCNAVNLEQKCLKDVIHILFQANSNHGNTHTGNPV